MSKFTKEELAKFKQDLDDINLDSESELEDSYYGKQLERMQSELIAIKKAKNNHSILEELKKNMEKQDEMITEYEQEISELQRITKNEEKNVIDDTLLNQIKLKVAQNSNNSFLQLADDQYNQSLLKQSLLEVQQSSVPMQDGKTFSKKSTFAQQIQKEESAIKKKLENANLEREHLAMQHEDKLSMKYEIEHLSNLFADRFIRPKLNPLHQKDTKIQLASTKLKSTFTNLSPQIVNQANVLPKNSPEIALKQLKQMKRKGLKSISQTNSKVVSKKIKGVDGDEFQEVQIKGQQRDKKISSLQSQFLQYISFIAKLLSPLQQISKHYNPKFLQLLDDKEKNVNYDFNQEQKVNQKQKLLSQVASLDNARQLKQLKLTFESITSLKGIQSFTNIRDAQLQFNALNVITPISYCKQLIRLNLSHNKIKDMSSVSEFPWLRFLNIEHNNVRQLKLKCESLQIVWGGNNAIEDLDVNACKYIRVLLLNNNKLNDLPKLKLYNLQELNLSKNQLKSLKNLEELILLKKLNFSYNRLQTVDQKLIYLYLNELNLSNNYINKLNLLFLPCLQHLYLNNNRLTTRTKSEFYFPNLKEINIDENKLQGFSPIWELLRYSKKVQYLRYSNNQYFLNLREKAREIYEYVIYKFMRNIKILNQSQMDIGIKKYYQSNYDMYYHHIEFFSSNHNIIKYLQSNINFILHQFTFAAILENKKSPFVKEKEYIYYQSVRKIKQLKSTINFIETYKKEQNIVFAISSSLLHHHDEFQVRRRNLYHKVSSLVVHYRYKKARRQKYYQKIKPQIQKQLNSLNRLINTSQIIKAILKFKNQLRGLTQQKAAIMIQKMWRGYIRRKLYKRLLQNKKKAEEEDSDFQDVDTDFFNQQLQRHEFNIENIEGINFEDLIIRPQVFEYLQNKHKKEEQESKQKGSKPKEKEEKILVNNFLDSQTKLKTKKEGKPTQEEQLIKQWGIKDDRLLKTLQYKQQKRMQARKKEEDKTLTAAERYERFKRGGR